MWTLLWWRNNAINRMEGLSYRKLRKRLRQFREWEPDSVTAIWEPVDHGPILLWSMVMQGTPDEILRALDHPWRQ